MAIELLSSAMIYQAQPMQGVQSAKSAQTAEKPGTGYMDRTGQEAAQIVDDVSVAPGSKNEENLEQAKLEKIRKAIDDLNRNSPNSEALYGIHEGTNRVTIKIVNKETKEVIKELPPEETLDMIAKIWEIAGLMVDERR